VPGSVIARETSSPLANRCDSTARHRAPLSSVNLPRCHVATVSRWARTGVIRWFANGAGLPVLSLGAPMGASEPLLVSNHAGHQPRAKHSRNPPDFPRRYSIQRYLYNVTRRILGPSSL
jgi:hypothetical protein